jgi:hypothetical protein
MRIVALTALLALGLSGCASKYKIDSLNSPSTHLSRDGGFYVMLARNGSYGVRVYKQSGYMTTQAVATALFAQNAKIVVAEKKEDLESAFSSAQGRGMSYVFQPIIRNWVDRATEWSGKPDRITLQFAVYDSKTKSRLATTTVRASSKWGTFGGDHPQDLLPVPTQQFIQQLF